MVGYPTDYLCIHQWIHLQNLMVHSYPMTNSIIERRNSIKKNTYNPHSIEWNYLMKSCGRVCPPLYTIRIGKIRKCCWTWPNLQKYDVSYEYLIDKYALLFR